jgi:RNA polymerase sigma-70 factor (ECF subfamily)
MDGHMLLDVLTALAMSRTPHAGGVDTPVRAAPSVAEVYERHFEYVYRCLRHLGVWEASLDDAAQDVFLVVHKKLADFDGGVPVTTWLYAIVIRIARRYRERQGKARRHDDDASLAHDRSPEGELDARRKLAFARRALDELDDDKREVFVLADVHQLPAAEIATITGAPLNTVYSRLRVARELFARATRRLAATSRRSP